MTNYNSILLASLPIVKKAGQFLQTHFRTVKSEDIEDKDVNSLVSYVDRQAEAILVNELQALIPESTFITEEDTVENKESEYTWIIDPLDGTTNFLFGLPHFAVSVALQHQGELVVGIVYHVSLEECFYATKGGGAFMNGQAIQVRSAKDLKDTLITTGMPFNDEEQVEAMLKLMRYWKKHTRGVRRLGSAALDLAYVAVGRVDAYVEWGLNAWDVAAGILILEEAGGKVTDLSKNKDSLKNGEIVASNKYIYDLIIASIKDSL